MPSTTRVGSKTTASPPDSGSRVRPGHLDGPGAELAGPLPHRHRVVRVVAGARHLHPDVVPDRAVRQSGRDLRLQPVVPGERAVRPVGGHRERHEGVAHPRGRPHGVDPAVGVDRVVGGLRVGVGRRERLRPQVGDERGDRRGPPRQEDRQQRRLLGGPDQRDEVLGRADGEARRGLAEQVGGRPVGQPEGDRHAAHVRRPVADPRVAGAVRPAHPDRDRLALQVGGAAERGRGGSGGEGAGVEAPLRVQGPEALVPAEGHLDLVDGAARMQHGRNLTPARQTRQGYPGIAGVRARARPWSAAPAPRTPRGRRGRPARGRCRP